MASSYTPAAAGRIIGVHGNTIRQMCAEYAVHLSPGCNPTSGQARVLTADDVARLQAIRDGKRAGVAVDTIIATFQLHPPQPYIESTTVSAAPPSAIVAPTGGDSVAMLMDVWQRGQDAATARLDGIERRISTLVVYALVAALMLFALGGLFVLLVLRGAI